VISHIQNFGDTTYYETNVPHQRQYTPLQQPIPDMHNQPAPSHHLPFQNSGPQRHQQQQAEADLDDSGIGMSLMDDDTNLSKYGVASPRLGVPGMGNPHAKVEVM